MNELELRRQLRALRADREPARDLWAPIANAIATPRPTRRVARWLPLSLAAACGLIALLIVQRDPAQPPSINIANDAVQSNVLPADALSPETVSGGLLAGAAAELDLEYRAALRSLPPAKLPDELQATASLLDDSATQLRAALHQQPESRYLLEQLRRVYEQRLRLAHPTWLG